MKLGLYAVLFAAVGLVGAPDISAEDDFATVSSQDSSSVETSSSRSAYGFRLGIHPAFNVARTVTSASVEGRNVSVAGDPQPGFGVGLSLGWTASWFSLESGAGWERRIQNFSGVNSQSDFIMVPLVAYIHPLDWFAFGAGAYYGYRFSRTLGAANAGSLVSVNEDGGFASNHDIGMMLTARFEGALSPRWGLYGEIRGAMSVMAFESVPGVQDRWDAIQIHAGLAFYP